MNKRTLKKLKDDVKIVKKISKILIKIDLENNVELRLNDNLEKGIGGIIAVIGPAENFEETLLLEVGTGRSRPYTEAIYPGYFVSYRRNLFKISSVQHRIVAPHVLNAIQFITDLRIARWKFYPENPFRVKYNNNWYTRKNGFNSWKISVNTIPAIRFAFSKSDEFIVNDMLCLFLFNDWTKKRMIGLGKYVDKVLSVYRNKKINFKQSRRFKNMAEVKRVLEKWPNFLVKEMLLRYLPEGSKNLFFHDLSGIIGWDGVTLSEQKEKALVSFFDIHNNDVISKIGIANRINYVRENDKFIFFDVCPSNYDPTKKQL